MTYDDEERRRAIAAASNATWRAKNQEARAAYMKEWEAKNREARNAYKRERLAENPELKEANQARVVAWVKENREARKEHQRRYREKNREKIGQANRQYIRNENGEITAKEKKHQERNRTQRALDLDALAGRPRPEVCEVCGNAPDKGKSLHFDHCHQRGHFRGWICRGCNLTLGYVSDDIGRLRKLIAYLERDKDGAA